MTDNKISLVLILEYAHLEMYKQTSYDKIKELFIAPFRNEHIVTQALTL